MRMRFLGDVKPGADINGIGAGNVIPMTLGWTSVRRQVQSMRNRLKSVYANLR